MRLIVIVTGFLVVAASLSGCEKPANKAGGDPCLNVKAAPPLQTYEQAVASCRNNQKMNGSPDAKRSNITITNH